MIYNSAISSSLRRLFQPAFVPRQGLIFNISMLEADILSTKSVVLIGPSGIGKTQYALSHFKMPLLVSHMDDLKKLEHHDGIVFDDMTFRHFPPQSCIHLTDLELPRSINVKYGTVQIRALLPRFFTSNRDFREVFSEHCSESEWAAIERRCFIHQLVHKLY